ncbi:MAG: carboxymuconolactone decarboxylase family protein, partial [Clostridia bacterium]|nr:carboxymuconolactone decarboxylase family protein [Clostridia bacterium]
MKRTVIKKIAVLTAAMTMGIMPAASAYGAESKNGVELEEMMEHYGSDFINEQLDTKKQQLIILATMTSLQAYSQIKEQTLTALDLKVTPEEIKEAVYQAAPYCGYTKALSAMEAVDEAFKER